MYLRLRALGSVLNTEGKKTEKNTFVYPQFLRGGQNTVQLGEQTSGERAEWALGQPQQSLGVGVLGRRR